MGIGGAKKKDLKTGAFKEHSLYTSLPVVVQLLHGITAVNEGGEGGEGVHLDSLT